MKRNTYPVDNSAILYLSLIRPVHTNVYRFSMELTEDICPEALQKATDRTFSRFPTIFAGFRPGTFQYDTVPASQSPRVSPDLGLLRTMSRKEIENCAYRILYSGKTVSIEAFHALTDGYGAICSFTTLIGEYLRIKYGVEIPIQFPLTDISAMPLEEEIKDEYPVQCSDNPYHLPSRYAYQLPGKEKGHWQVRTNIRSYRTAQILEAARRRKVSATALLSGIMAKAIAQLQQTQVSFRHQKPVRIMIPVDLRRLFPSCTLRNFILYALPTLEKECFNHSVETVMSNLDTQLRSQINRERMANLMAYNVKAQASVLFRAIPLAIKCTAMRAAYRFFGESNSSITLTNLGNIKLPEVMSNYVTDFQVTLTPRARSPYNCAVISYDDRLNISLSSFCRKPELESLFFGLLDETLTD